MQLVAQIKTIRYALMHLVAYAEYLLMASVIEFPSLIVIIEFSFFLNKEMPCHLILT